MVFPANNEGASVFSFSTDVVVAVVENKSGFPLLVFQYPVCNKSLIFLSCSVSNMFPDN